MHKRIVVALGSLPQESLQLSLGDHYRFIEHPNNSDLANAEAAIVRADFDLTEEVIAGMPELKVVARTGVGVERVDLTAATERGIPVLITPGANSVAVAEGTLAHLLTLSKQLTPLTALVREGRWNQREDVVVRDLAGSYLGLIGFGRIGSRVAELAAAFGMKVGVFDPFASVPRELNVAGIEELLRASEFLSIHVPLTDQTRNLISAKEINLMPAGAIIVNCSRGGVLNLDAALHGLRTGRLSGVGLDSFDPEPARHHDIFDEPNVTLTPHVMGLSVKARAATFEMAAKGIRGFFSGQHDLSIANREMMGK